MEPEGVVAAAGSVLPLGRAGGGRRRGTGLPVETLPPQCRLLRAVAAVVRGEHGA